MTIVDSRQNGNHCNNKKKDKTTEQTRLGLTNTPKNKNNITHTKEKEKTSQSLLNILEI